MVPCEIFVDMLGNFVVVVVLLLPLALQPIVSLGLLNDVPPFLSVCHYLSPSSHS